MQWNGLLEARTMAHESEQYQDVAQALETNEDWSVLDSNARSSTTAYFVGGIARDGTEYADQIIIWEGVEREGTVNLVSHLGNDVPEDARYIVERHEDENLKEERFTAELDGAIEAANDLVANFDEGSETRTDGGLEQRAFADLDAIAAIAEEGLKALSVAEIDEAEDKLRQILAKAEAWDDPGSGAAANEAELPGLPFPALEGCPKCGALSLEGVKLSEDEFLAGLDCGGGIAHLKEDVHLGTRYTDLECVECGETLIEDGEAVHEEVEGR